MINVFITFEGNLNAVNPPIYPPKAANIIMLKANGQKTSPAILKTITDTKVRTNENKAFKASISSIFLLPLTEKTASKAMPNPPLK